MDTTDVLSLTLTVNHNVKSSFTNKQRRTTLDCTLDCTLDYRTRKSLKVQVWVIHKTNALLIRHPGNIVVSN